MGIGPHTYPAMAQQAKPTLPFEPDMETSTSSVKSTTYRNKMYQAGQPKAAVWLEKEQAFFIADGYSPMRILRGSAWARVGILPPKPDDITVTPTGAQASMTIDITGIGHAAGDFFFIGNNLNSTTIYWVTALITDPSLPAWPGHQVLIGATPAETMANLSALINDASGHDVVYHNAMRATGVGTWQFRDNYEIEASGSAPVTITAIPHGAVGNLFRYSAFDVGAVVTLAPTDANWATIGYFSGGSAGTGTAPDIGTYEYTYRHFRKMDGAFSGIGARVTQAIGQPMNVYLVMTDPADDPQVTHLQWMRSLHKSGQFYTGGEAKVGTGGAATDDKLDTEIGVTQNPYNDVEFRPYESGHVPMYRCVETHLGIVFAGGAFLLRDKDIELTLTNGSYDATVVVGSGIWQPEMEGGLLVFDTHDGEEYVAVDYDNATQTVRLNKPWPHTGGDFEGEWSDQRDNTYVAYSMPGKPNQFPPGNGLEGVSDETGEGITGLKAFWSRLNVFTPDSIYALSGTFGAFQLKRVVKGIGTVSHHAIVEAEGMLFFPGPGAFFAWAGGETPLNLTDPTGEPRGLGDTMKRINWSVADQITGHFDPIQRIIRWCVPMDDEWYPTHTLVFDIPNNAWHVDDGLAMDRFETVTVGGQQYAMGARAVSMFFSDLSGNDNYHAGVCRDTLAAVYPDRNEITTTLGSGTSGERMGAVIVTAAGDYYPVEMTGLSASWLILTKDVIENLTAGDQILLGGICFYLRTGEMSFGYMARRGRITDLDVGFAPQTLSGRVYAAVSSDGSATTLPEFGEEYGDLTEADGHWRARLNKAGHRQTLDLVSAMAGDYPELIEIGLGYRTPNKRRHSV